MKEYIQIVGELLRRPIWNSVIGCPLHKGKVLPGWSFYWNQPKCLTRLSKQPVFPMNGLTWLHSDATILQSSVFSYSWKPSKSNLVGAFHKIGYSQSVKLFGCLAIAKKVDQQCPQLHLSNLWAFYAQCFPEIDLQFMFKVTSQAAPSEISQGLPRKHLPGKRSKLQMDHSIASRQSTPYNHHPPHVYTMGNSSQKVLDFAGNHHPCICFDEEPPPAAANCPPSKQLPLASQP